MTAIEPEIDDNETYFIDRLIGPIHLLRLLTEVDEFELFIQRHGDGLSADLLSGHQFCVERQQQEHHLWVAFSVHTSK